MAPQNLSKSPQSKMEAPVVETATGKLRGFKNPDSGLFQFFGVPYAEPPLGGLRFKYPVAKKPWDGILDATRFGYAGPQVFDPSEGSYEEFTGEKPGPNQNPWVGSEDNLTLNIWTPAADKQKRPVMVWIHGGANWLESSRLENYHGDRFAERGNVVFVSINYRLGIFGFVDLSVIGGEEYYGSHSNGMRDQVVALQWIKNNIAAFGGDPENITVMGESAGSIDTSWLLTSGHLDGLAKRVVLMSGVAGLLGLSGDLGYGFTEEYGQKLARDFLSRMNIGSMDELKALSTDQIMERVTNVARSTDMLFYMDSLFWPRVSKDFAPVDPLRAVSGNVGKNIDVLIGYTGYEMGLWLTWDETLDQHPPIWSAEKIQDFDDKQRAEAVDLYGKVMTGQPEGTLGMHMIGDSIFVMPATWFAEGLAKRGSKVWMYQFDWEADEKRKALHAADQTFLFDKNETHAGLHLVGKPSDDADLKARKNLTENMQDAFLSFAIHGTPNAENLPEWPKYDTKTRSVMSFNLQSRIIDDPVSERRKWWFGKVYEPAIIQSVDK